MSLDELIRNILLLPPADKDKLLSILESERGNRLEGFLPLQMLTKLPEWEEIHTRAQEVIHEEKVCLIHFDDHIQAITV